MSGLITLTTDFGLTDPYVGVMKGVILTRCPSARLIDLTHLLPPQDVAAACLFLEDAHPYFPPGTLHVAVVDPEVGATRCVLWARTATAQFLAPDNGLLSFLTPEHVQELRRVENPRYWLHPVSHTFHGRDIFAPVAGELARGLAPARLGPLTRVMHRLEQPRPTRVAGQLRGQVLTFDHFGNARTNLRAADLPSPATVRVAGATVPLADTYAAVPRGTALALVGSSGRLEISVRDGSAQRLLGLRRGTPVELALPGPSETAVLASPQPRAVAPPPKENPMLLDAERSCLLVIDIQEKLVPAVHRADLLIERCCWLIAIAQQLGIPILASEQYPRGLGRTIGPVAAALGETQILEKLHFSCADDAGCREALDGLGREQVVIVGMEAHVCVLQTALGLRQQGREVFVVADIVASRDPENVDLALARLRQAGVWVVSREMAVFEWLGRAGTDTFRSISRAYLR